MRTLEPPKRRILIVDDTMANVEILLDALESLYDVSFATSGAEALRLINEGDLPDLILLDIMMPDMDGYEVCAKLKESPATREIAVIFVTALDTQDSESAGLKLGADDYITKPINIEIARLRIKNLLERTWLAQELELALTNSRQGLWEWDLGLNTVRLDPRWGVALGYAAGEMPEQPSTWSRLLHPDDLVTLLTAGDQHFGHECDTIDVEVRMRNKGDGFTWVHVLGRGILPDSRGFPIRVVGTYMDISQRKQDALALDDARKHLATVISSIPDAILALDNSACVTELHLPSSYQHLLSDANWKGRSYTELLPPALATAIETAMLAVLDKVLPQTEDCELEIDGEFHFYTVNLSRLSGTGDWPNGFIAVIRDATQIRINEEALRQMALHDPLTKLPNRRHLNQHLEELKQDKRHEHEYAALMLIDLDHFKQVNDTHGHEAGDQLLIEVARRASAVIRDEDLVARLGGDEFVVLLEHLGADEAGAEANAQRVMEKLNEVLNSNFRLGQLDLNCSASIGIQRFIPKQADTTEVLQEADRAMYRMKSEKAERRPQGG